MNHLENIKLPWADWEITKKLGRGGFGSVYEIEKTVLGHTEKSALKIISIPLNEEVLEADYAEGYDNDSLALKYKLELESLMKEYQFMYEFRGESTIVNCEDIATMPQDNGIGWNLYIRMELLRPLVSELKVHPFTEEDVLNLGVDICTALVLCEQKNVIHRDIKPENIMVSPLGRYKLGDFGIARTMDHATQATRIGTIRYMAPEVISGEKYGFGVDIYSLGLVMYWLLNCRRMPFLPTDRVPTPEEVTTAQAKRVEGIILPPPCAGSTELQEIILKACSFLPSERYGSASEMLEALHALQDSKGLGTVVSMPVQPSNPAERHYSQSISGKEDEKAEPPKQKKKGPVIIVVLVIVAIAVLAGAIWGSQHNKKQADAAEAAVEISAEDEAIDSEEAANDQTDMVMDESVDAEEVTSDTENHDEHDVESDASEADIVVEDILGKTESEVHIGDVVSLGCYEQDNDLDNGQEPIEWMVLDKGGGSVLLISKYVLELEPYNDVFESVTWETCSLRRWLNSEFLNNSFSEEERASIATVEVPADENLLYDSDPGNPTQDQVFILSVKEAKKYFRNDGKVGETQALGTDYVVAKYIIDMQPIWDEFEAEFQAEQEEGQWNRYIPAIYGFWLRTPGEENVQAMIADFTYYYDGRFCHETLYGVRPCMWVTLEP